MNPTLRHRHNFRPTASFNAPISGIYDPANARLLAVACANAYAADVLDQDGIQVIDHIATETRAVVTKTRRDCVVAFRGTADLRNWVTDFECKKMPLVWSAGRVHRGFNLALEAMAGQLDEALSPADSRRIWVTGHSLGGALALLFALRLTLRRAMSVAGVYTFGQPRVGNVLFSLGYDAALKPRTFRIVNADDIVPHVPWMLGTYHHAGHEIFFSGAQPFELDRPWWTRLPADARTLALEMAQGKLALLEDHHIRRYVALLGAGDAPAQPQDRPLAVCN